ncbi:MAG: oligoribonuclease [Deltaproteobacteria bacterium]|nr:oligoribonuclease [Deltaproteobacteria bacterium]
MESRLVWMDLEMTGLDADRHTIVEIATLVTDSELELVAQGPSLVIHQPDEELAKMDDFVVAMHTKSGLLERIRSSQVTLAEAEAQTLEFVRAHCEPRTAPLCGNSIHQDRRFIERHMPTLQRHFHYRNIDVSTVKELVRRWYGDAVPPYQKGDKHRAMDDIVESIGELRHYRSRVFVGT